MSCVIAPMCRLDEGGGQWLFAWGGQAYSARPTRITANVRPPDLRVSAQSCSPSLPRAPGAAPAGGLSSENTAGWLVPDALVLIWTSAAKSGLAAGSVSS